LSEEVKEVFMEDYMRVVARVGEVKVVGLVVGV
jgi:hypothetical protein